MIRARVVLLRDLGAAMSPFNAFQFLQGLETLPLRMAAPLRQRPGGGGLPQGPPRTSTNDHPPLGPGPATRRARADRVSRPAATGAWWVSNWPAGCDAGRRFIDALQLFYHVANIGDARSLAIHPASTTHSQLSAEEQLATGVSEGYVRLSVGLEHIDDILGDLEDALAAAG